jgi:hypothetical protein
MIPVPNDVLKRLRLEHAITDEAQSWQSLMPSQPGWDQAAAEAPALARWLNGQLLSGLATVRDVVVSARKVHHGVRPVPVWGLAERVTYRALVEFILRNEPQLDRSPEAYLEFISAPVKYAQALEPLPSRGRIPLLANSVIRYVVQTDITAFYECVDHGILSRELLTRTGDYAAIECLMSLLAEVQGRSFGLPQLLEPSDRLSEAYIDIVERDMLRRGWAAWRFNDDFRIAVRDFGSALAAIEDLAASARETGLTLSDLKTTTPRYTTYLLHNFGLKIDDEVPEDLRRQQAEEAVGDYTEGVGETDPTWAVKRIADANSPDMKRAQRSKDGIDLGSVRGDDFRVLRRALARLIRAGIADSLPDVLKLLAYVPSLTPWVIRYVIAAGDEHLAEALKVLDEVVAKISLSDWQRVWVIRALDELKALTSAAPGDPAARTGWVTDLRHSRCGPIVYAEAAVALAAVGKIDFVELEYALRTQPAALTPWYLAGVRRLGGRGGATDDQYAAIRREGGLYTVLLPERA